MKRPAGALAHVRRLAGHPRLVPMTALLLRARAVRPAGAFVLRELTRSTAASTYRLRRNGLRVCVRHGTGDVVTLGEIFHELHYQPPDEVDEHLGRVVQILDLGANVGLFGAFAATRWPGSEILAFEPDPTNAVLHQRVIEMNGLQARWRLRRAAAGTEAGEASFVAGEIALSHLAGAGEVAGAIEVSVEDVMPHLAGADLLKMDIEGGEWAILSDPRFRESPPRALVLEYHPRSCPEPEPRGTAESLLRAAGLSVQSIWHRDDGHGMLWAWRS